MSQRSLIKISLIDKISEFIPEAQIRQDEPMSKHSSFRIGGPADAVVTVCSEEELSKLEMAPICCSLTKDTAA